MKKIFAFVLLCIFWFSCGKKPIADPADGGSNGGNSDGPNGTCSAKSFTNDVNPIVQNSCATAVSCHGAGSTTGPGPLLTYTQIFNVRAIIRSEVASGRMPLNGSLSATQKNAILCWIDNGAPNN